MALPCPVDRREPNGSGPGGTARLCFWRWLLVALAMSVPLALNGWTPPAPDGGRTATDLLASLTTLCHAGTAVPEHPRPKPAGSSHGLFCLLADAAASLLPVSAPLPMVSPSVRATGYRSRPPVRAPPPFVAGPFQARAPPGSDPR
ncbi:hypothetical protein [Rhizosaccharibacter radicis]|uniref:DUF2946 domain-containing protein n=1 Tax=Rhizosaccharibacter radicis TaxID=2782605 RepID=A0ABT1VUM0_9PROT|nr:hypothetical protein [Acetobacteraceae bacterium KSS12]